MREHLNAALSPEPERMKELEVQVKETLQAQPPKKVWHRINKKRVEMASDLVLSAGRLLSVKMKRGAARPRVEQPAFRIANEELRIVCAPAAITDRDAHLAQLLFGSSNIGNR